MICLRSHAYQYVLQRLGKTVDNHNSFEFKIHCKGKMKSVKIGGVLVIKTNKSVEFNCQKNIIRKQSIRQIYVVLFGRKRNNC